MKKPKQKWIDVRAPEGYVSRNEWAMAQIRAGLRQKQCPKCKLWVFPQEKCQCK